MALKIVTHAERPDLLDRWYEVIREVWPVFMGQDSVCNQYWPGLEEHFPDCQTYLIDDQTDELVGKGSTVPAVWDGTIAGLPGGVDDALLAAFRDRDVQPTPTVLCALQAGVLPGHRGQGLSTTIIGAMRDTAIRRGYADLIAPVRPNQKSRYPLTPIERYVTWRRPDGLPVDQWLRIHERLGATFLAICERSMVVKGTVEAWASWTGLTFPDSGPYVVPGALVPITIDREADQGLYVEPNVWMRHRVRND